MGFFSKVFRGRVTLDSLSPEVAGAFLKIFATSPSLRGQTFNANNQDETFEILFFYLSAVYCSFYSHLSPSDGQLMNALAQMRLQAGCDLVEARPDLNPDIYGAGQFIGEKFTKYFKLCEPCEGNKEVLTVILQMALREKIPSLSTDEARLNKIVAQFIIIHDD